MLQISPESIYLVICTAKINTVDCFFGTHHFYTFMTQTPALVICFVGILLVVVNNMCLKTSTNTADTIFKFASSCLHFKFILSSERVLSLPMQDAIFNLIKIWAKIQLSSPYVSHTQQFSTVFKHTWKSFSLVYWAYVFEIYSSLNFFFFFALFNLKDHPTFKLPIKNTNSRKMLYDKNQTTFFRDLKPYGKVTGV